MILMKHIALITLIKRFAHFLLYASINGAPVGRYVNIMVFTEDLWFLSGMTTVLLQKT